MKTLSIAFLSLLTITLSGCGQKPMTDADMAVKYGLSIEEYQEQKEVAARMNMSVEDHLSMEDDNSYMDHDMGNMTDSEMDSHEKDAANMGMSMDEHESAGHMEK